MNRDVMPRLPELILNRRADAPAHAGGYSEQTAIGVVPVANGEETPTTADRLSTARVEVAPPLGRRSADGRAGAAGVEAVGESEIDALVVEHASDPPATDVLGVAIALAALAHSLWLGSRHRRDRTAADDHQRRLDEIEASKYLDEAWDALGGRQFSTNISDRRLTSDPNALERARRLVEMAITRAPDFTRSHWVAGVYYQACGDYSAAEESHRRSLELDEQNVRAHNSLGNTLSRLHREREAIECYSRAVAIDPSFDLALASRGWLRASLGDLRAGLADLDEALRLDPTNSGTQRRRDEIAERIADATEVGAKSGGSQSS